MYYCFIICKYRIDTYGITDLISAYLFYFSIKKNKKKASVFHISRGIISSIVRKTNEKILYYEAISS